MKTITSVTLLMFLFWGCTQSTDSDYYYQLKVSKTSDGASYTLTINKNIFQLTDSLEIKFEVENLSIFLKRYDFNNIQQFGFKLTNESGNVALFYPMIVSPALSHFILQLGQSKIFSISYPFKDHNGNFISQGNYNLFASLSDGNSPEVSLRLSVK